MHVPDGFLDATTSVATGLASAVVVAVALRKARNELDEKTAPLAGLVAVFIFAVQMLNFPVGAGTSGHLMGGALAAVLVGPWTGVLCLTVVLLVQGLLFADGGLSALGTNILLIGIVTVVVGWTLTRLLQLLLPRRPSSVVPASFAGALISVPAAALVFSFLFVLGGAVDLPIRTLLTTMVGWHSLIGIGEAVITAATVSAIVALRPDLVYAVRELMPVLRLRGADGRLSPAPADNETASGRLPTGKVLLGFAGVSAVLAGIVSFFASAQPDGLEFAAGKLGFLDSAREHALSAFDLADYGEVGGIPVGIAGLIGITVMGLVSVLLFRALASRR